MKILHFLPLESPCILTIGNFDGVHLGHRFVLSKLKEYADQYHSPSVVITFENHPSEILRPDYVTPLICTLPHRIHLLEKEQIDYLYLLKFSKTFSEQTAAQFLTNLRKKLPFSHLILGHDATLGKERKGNREEIKKLAKTLNFEVEYLDQWKQDENTISSSQIRKAIQKGDLETAKHLLGRPYSILSTVIKSSGLGKKLGYPTANLDLSGLCLPPYGVYGVQVSYKENTYNGIANLGLAPTTRTDAKPQLEVHLFDFDQQLYGEEIEVTLHQYLRPELKFSSLSELQTQIAQDIQQLKQSKKKEFPCR